MFGGDKNLKDLAMKKIDKKQMLVKIWKWILAFIAACTIVAFVICAVCFLLKKECIFKDFNPFLYSWVHGSLEYVCENYCSHTWVRTIILIVLFILVRIGLINVLPKLCVGVIYFPCAVLSRFLSLLQFERICEWLSDIGFFKGVIEFFKGIMRLIWEIFVRCLRIINIAFYYMANKHLSILFCAMVGVVCVSASLHRLICGNNDNNSNENSNNRNVSTNENSNNKNVSTNENFVIFEKENLLWVLDKMFSYDKMREEIVCYIGNNIKSGTEKNDKSSAANNAESGTERNDILSLKKRKAILAFVLFLFTWFVGGGVLVSALIATTIDIWSGKWRLWGVLLGNHTVILGWDETVPILLRDHIESHRFWFFRRPETIVIMTEHPAHKVRLALRDVLCKPILKGILRWPYIMISSVVLHGKFDDDEEIRNLHLQRANSIYVVGEMDDAAHDIRVLMTPPKLEKHSNSLLQREYFQFTRRRLNCHLNIRNLHLFWQHIKGKGRIGDNRICLRSLNIVPHNFYDSWVKRLFSRVPIGGIGKDEGVHFSFREKDQDVHIVIIGFGCFGQALAVEAAAVAHYGDKRRTYITVIDDDIGEKERDFRALFPRIDEITDLNLSFITDVKIGSSKFIEMLAAFGGRKQQLTIAITMENDNDGLKLVLPIYKAVTDKKVQLIVKQQSCETELDGKEETFNGMYGCKNVKFFGFSNGTGFDVWRREKIARKLVRKVKGKWRDLEEREKQYFRMMIDGLEEFYYVRNLGEEGNDKGGSDNETFKRIDLAVRRLLDGDGGFFQGKNVVEAMAQLPRRLSKRR